MKTTIEMPDALFMQARQYANKNNMTMKALIEQALRKIMVKKTAEKPFKLADGSFRGNGLTPEFQNATWEQIRDTIYERG
jgi:hypothetical protein